MFCQKCGREIPDGSALCANCGAKAGESGAAITQFNASADEANKKAKKKTIRIIAISVIALALIGVGAFFASNLFVSVDDLCAQGNYLQAYEKASDEKKVEIKAESIAAALSSDFLSRSPIPLNDPDSFKLMAVYYQENTDSPVRLVLKININAFGGTLTDYCLYMWDTESQDWEFWGVVSDSELLKESNDFSDVIKKTNVKSATRDGIKLNNTAIQRINDMFEAGTLDDVEPIK